MAEVAERDELLAAAAVAHVGITVDGLPVVIPLLVEHLAGVLYFHGAPASRVLRALGSGQPVCATVTVLDGLVASRTALNHSANYRSVVAFGRGAEVTDAAVKRAVLERLTTRLFGGRSVGSDYQAATPKDLAGTRMVAVTVEAWSGKRRTGPPLGPLDAELPPDHEALGFWAGVVEVAGGGIAAAAAAAS